MPLIIGKSGNPDFTASSSEIDITDAIENSFERATIFVIGDSTATLTIRFYGQPQMNFARNVWFQIGSDKTQEPATNKAYVCPDLFPNFKVSAVRAGTGDCAGACWLVWEALYGATIKRARGTRP